MADKNNNNNNNNNNKQGSRIESRVFWARLPQRYDDSFHLPIGVQVLKPGQKFVHLLEHVYRRALRSCWSGWDASPYREFVNGKWYRVAGNLKRLAEQRLEQGVVKGGPNLVASATATGAHAPCIDLDYPAMCLPSKTPGHYHLYLQKEVTWKQYIILLKSLTSCGLIEKAYADASIARGASFLRVNDMTLLAVRMSEAEETGDKAYPEGEGYR